MIRPPRLPGICEPQDLPAFIRAPHTLESKASRLYRLPSFSQMPGIRVWEYFGDA